MTETPTDILIQELITLGCPAPKAFRLVNEAKVQWAAEPKQRSRHSLAQSKYYLKKKAENCSQQQSFDDHSMIRDDHSKEVPHTPKENITTTLPFTSLRSVNAPNKSALYSESLDILKKLTGNGEASCRSLIGRWCKIVDGDFVHVMAAIEDAAKEEPIDPRGWIFGRLQRVADDRNQNRAKPLTQSQKDRAEFNRKMNAIKEMRNAIPENTPQISLTLGTSDREAVSSSG